MPAQSNELPAQPDETEPIEGPPAPIRWRSWPLTERPGRTGLVLLALLAATLLVRLMTGRMLLALLALAALVTALWRYFLPVEFELDDHGVEQSLLGWRRQVPWSAIGRYEVCRAGVLLVPTNDHTPMSAFAGLFLPFADNRDAVLLRLRYYLAPQGSP